MRFGGRRLERVAEPIGKKDQRKKGLNDNWEGETRYHGWRGGVRAAERAEGGPIRNAGRVRDRVRVHG